MRKNMGQLSVKDQGSARPVLGEGGPALPSSMAPAIGILGWGGGWEQREARRPSVGQAQGSAPVREGGAGARVAVAPPTPP